MKVLVTGSGGLVGSEASLYFASKGWLVYGIDNNTRFNLFGLDASVRNRINELKVLDTYTHFELDIVNKKMVESIVSRICPDVVIHTAAQPSHDWAAKNPHFDFNINALGTLNLLEAVRNVNSSAIFIYTSTNKVYGDTPNTLPFVEDESRWSLPTWHKWFNGIDESMSIDSSTHSLFGVSKLSGDLLVQEYGRYFNMFTVSFRCGCITGPAHRGTELHGFLSYLMKCLVKKTPYVVYGYKGKQVRDNIHASDLVDAFKCYIESPTVGEVYNIGGGCSNSISVLEAIELSEHIANEKLIWTYNDKARIGDHKWWISSIKKFQKRYDWKLRYSIEDILREIYENAKRNI